MISLITYHSLFEIGVKMQQTYPILEYDDDLEAMITPGATPMWICPNIVSSVFFGMSLTTLSIVACSHA